MDVNLTHSGAQLDDAITKVLADYADVSGVTAVAADVIAPKVFIDATGAEVIGINIGGTDTSDATATASDILNGKTAYLSDGKNMGSMPDKSGTTQDTVAADDTVNNYINLSIPANGYYNTLAKLRESYADLAALIGLTATKIVVGNTILGIAGIASVPEVEMIWNE